MVKLAIVSAIMVLLTGCVIEKAVQPNTANYSPAAPVAEYPDTYSAGSIYVANRSVDLFHDRTAYRIGDILTINLSERTQSSKDQSTALSKSSSNSLSAPNFLGTAPSINGNEVGIDMSQSRNFAGDGSSDQSNALSGVITVSVVDVLPNGVMKVRGEKWLTLNQGDEYVRLSGLIRIEDVGADNSVDSARVGNARISYAGHGVHDQVNKQGWFDRFFSSEWWPL